MYELSLKSAKSRNPGVHLHSVATTVDDQVSLLHQEGPPVEKIRRGTLDRRALGIAIPTVLGLAT
jgi:hypothetical protein